MRKPPKSAKQDTLPQIRDYEREQIVARERHLEEVMQIWNAGLSGEKLFTTVMLIVCGLPLSDEKGRGEVVRKAQLGDKSWVKVTFSQGDKNVPLPFGADRSMIYFLTNKAVLQKSPFLDWKYANEYMNLFGLALSGKNYQDVQARFLRAVYLNIRVDYIDKEGGTVDHWKSPLIDYARVSAEIDEKGNWKPSMTISKMLEGEQKIRFGSVLFEELKKGPVPIPIELIRAAGKKYRVLDYMIFLYWRAFAGQSQSFIPWRYLQEQFDSADPNPHRWPMYFRTAYKIMKSLPDPVNQIRADITSAGITIYPLPIGTSFFEGQPKLGYKNSLPNVGAGN